MEHTDGQVVRLLDNTGLLYPEFGYIVGSRFLLRRVRSLMESAGIDQQYDVGRF